MFIIKALKSGKVYAGGNDWSSRDQSAKEYKTETAAKSVATRLKKDVTVGNAELIIVERNYYVQTRR